MGIIKAFERKARLRALESMNSYWANMEGLMRSERRFVGMAELCIHSELEIDKAAALLDYSYHLGRLAKKFTVEDRFAVIDASITLDPYVEDPITRRVLSDSGIQREEYGKIVISYGLTDPAFIAQALAAQVQNQKDPSSSEVQL